SCLPYPWPIRTCLRHKVTRSTSKRQRSNVLHEHILHAFSRFGVVYGGTYMLNKPECKVEFDEKGKVCGVTSEGEKLSAKKLFAILHVFLARPHFLYYHNAFFLSIPLRKTYAAHSETTEARMLVGNKCDLDNIRAISMEDEKNLAEKQGLFFMETSALDSTNVKIAFEMVIKDIYNNVELRVWKILYADVLQRNEEQR
nr:Ras-related protein RABA5c-like [Tanacetum cinerariifolium]